MITLSVTRSVRSNISVDVRYVGTMQLKGYRDLNLNSPDFLYNGLKEAFDAARSGGARNDDERRLVREPQDRRDLVGRPRTGDYVR